MAGNFTVILDRAHLKTRMKNGKDRASAALAEQILADSLDYVPIDQGTLTGSGRAAVTDYGVELSWNTVYAAYQWYGCWPDGSHVIRNYDHFKHSHATGKWVEAAREKYDKDWQKIAQREHVKGAK